MAPQRKREPRENNFHNVGVQGRKTGITLADRGVYDEHGLEPISGIFSSPEKSPPKRGGSIVAGSESMELQESSIPELITSRQIVRNSRTHLPPPRSRSPKKTALGSSPRRHSSMAPRASSVNSSSPPSRTSHPTVRRLDFSQEEASVHETPALSGSGARRDKRSDVYDIPEDDSPVLPTGAAIDGSTELQDASELQESIVLAGVAEESFAVQNEHDTMIESAAEQPARLEEREPHSSSVNALGARGRKRRNHVLEPAQEGVASTALRKKSRAASQQKIEKGNRPVQERKTRRSQRVSDMSDVDAGTGDVSVDVSVQIAEQTEEVPAPPKRRGRPGRARPEKEKVGGVSNKLSPPAAPEEQPAGKFKKPHRVAAKPDSGTEPKSKPGSQKCEEISQPIGDESGKLVDMHGRPLSKKDIEQMSATSAGSRYGRGRHLSVFREMDPETVARVGRSGRHRVAPIDFWKNDRIAYDVDGSMTSIVKNQAQEPERKMHKSTGARSRKKLSSVHEEEEDIDLDPWEEEDGVLVGNYVDFDPVMDIASTNVIEGAIAWADKGVKPADVPDGSFKYIKLSSGGSFFNWGLIELQADQMKRTKNSRKMHMVFNVQSGTVEVKVHDNEFVVHKRGIWQVPRGNMYSIRNIGSGMARIFFAQAMQTTIRVLQEDEE